MMKIQCMQQIKLQILDQEQEQMVEMLQHSGTAEEIKLVPKSITGQYLSGRRQIHVPKKRRKSNGKSIEVCDATENNLKNINEIGRAHV